MELTSVSVKPNVLGCSFQVFLIRPLKCNLHTQFSIVTASCYILDEPVMRLIRTSTHGNPVSTAGAALLELLAVDKKIRG